MTAATTPACPSAADPASCGYVAARGASLVTLVSGEQCCSWCPRWLAETGERETLARRIMRLPDRHARRRLLDSHEASLGAAGPEARARLEAVILELWQRARAVEAQP